jgi:outer membrane protein assembly factor BamD (BamD/ComL family)
VAAAADSQPVPETHAPQRTTTMVDDELLLLRRAQAALRAGDPKRALMQLAEHRWRFPNGQLADSREVARMLALCANGDRQLVRAEASDFLAAHPHSPFAQRVRAICAEPQR